MADVKQQTDQERLEREAAFHDNSFASDLRAETDKFYAITLNSRAYYRDLILGNVVGKRVLEYGCGTGSSAFEIAELGGYAAGIDISPVAIDIAHRIAEERGLSENTEFHVMNAEALEFPDGSFDVICGTGILHHLDLERSFAEIKRVLRPNGVAIFTEPLGHNPLINWYRNRTPDLRTEDEHPLMADDISLARRYFSSVETKRFHLLSLGAVPFRSTPLFKPVLGMTELLDRVLVGNVSPLRDWAWVVVLQMKK